MDYNVEAAEKKCKFSVAILSPLNFRQQKSHLSKGGLII
ncbi:hypothetical protein EC836_108215 [Erwinia sp. JUb26]|nr:hypothetical protein EC836_108215 [Erwinia sp. JUb26]